MEGETLKMALAGDEAALTRLCRELHPKLHRFFSRLERIGSYRQLPGKTFEGWAFRLAWNLYLDAKRKKREAPLPLDYDPPSSDPTPETRAVENERAHCLRKAVARLDDESRAMVALRYEMDLSYREIAAALGTFPNRVKWRLHDALKRLEAELKKEGYP